MKTWPDPVRTQERNDCGVCAVQYVARLFGLPEDREAIKACPDWDPLGGVPLSYLHRHGCKTPGWICDDLEYDDDPERNQVRICPSSEHNVSVLWQAYRMQTERNRPGIVTWMVPGGAHAEVVLDAYVRDGVKRVVIADSLQGLKDLPATEAFAGLSGRLRGKAVTWVIRPG